MKHICAVEAAVTLIARPRLYHNSSVKGLTLFRTLECKSITPAQDGCSNPYNACVCLIN